MGRLFGWGSGRKISHPPQAIRNRILHLEGWNSMRTLIWVLVTLALIAIIVGAVVKVLAFLLWIAPILVAVAIALFVMNRTGYRRIP